VQLLQVEKGRERRRLSIVLFAMIGAAIKAGAWYWVCFAVYCLAKVARLFDDIIEEQRTEAIIKKISQINLKL
jgi:hypothetical protein